MREVSSRRRRKLEKRGEHCHFVRWTVNGKCRYAWSGAIPETFTMRIGPWQSPAWAPPPVSTFQELAALAQDPRILMVGWNNEAFDDKMLAAHGITVANSLDLKRLVGIAAQDHKLSLSAVSAANGMPPKEKGSGTLAPELYQSARIGQLVDYCLSDVIRTKNLVDLCLQGKLRMPPSYQTIQVDTARLIQFMHGM